MMPESLLSIKIEPLEKDGYLATSDDLPELLAQGRAVAETLEIAQDVARKIVEAYLDHGDPLPDVLKTAILAGVAIEARIPHQWPHDQIAGHDTGPGNPEIQKREVSFSTARQKGAMRYGIIL